jgi:hypothetical protein
MEHKNTVNTSEAAINLRYQGIVPSMDTKAPRYISVFIKENLSPRISGRFSVIHEESRSLRSLLKKEQK